ncbi:hypothetical protein lerEdw1_020792 [Lerista edwardsae]|nr:hypothetical protein lerEdw1_020792 [Lerista edwardsae]
MVGLVLLLLLLPQMVCQKEATKCPMNEPLPIPHEWRQPGDLLIGGIASQIVYLFPQVTFTEYSSQQLGFDLPM